MLAMDLGPSNVMIKWRVISMYKMASLHFLAVSYPLSLIELLMFLKLYVSFFGNGNQTEILSV